MAKLKVTNTGFVLDCTPSKKVKVGSSIQLQGNTYDFNGSVVAVEPTNGVLGFGHRHATSDNLSLDEATFF